MGIFAVTAQVVKIGEGTYGEAFKGNGTVFKIVPMEGPQLINNAPQKNAGDLMAEAVIALTLSRLRHDKDASGDRNGPYCPDVLFMNWCCCNCHGSIPAVVLDGRFPDPGALSQCI